MRSRATKIWVVLHGGRAPAGEPEPPGGPEAIQMEDGTAILMEDGSDILVE